MNYPLSKASGIAAYFISKIYLSIKNYGMFSAFEVRDKNPPVPENERNKIFKRFYRGSNSYSKDGIGIGLYLVKEIAVIYGGYMKLNSDKSGNRFTMVLSDKL
ncbi:MAG: HAMP domain-containing histidine kinase [Ruminococcus sp.]|nr:HAMP domain-containing histidine kinase [Ruminococcus sp.]